MNNGTPDDPEPNPRASVGQSHHSGGQQRILILLDNLAAGGAQRQICILAKLLKERGFDVLVVTYHSDTFFADELHDAGVAMHRVDRGGKYSRGIYIRSFIRKWCPDVVIAFMGTPAVFAEFSGLPARRFGLIVSERTGKIGKASWRDMIRLRLHALADAIVTNSNHLRDFVVTNNPRLASRVHVIQNCVDFSVFVPPVHVRRDKETFEIVTLGRYAPEKNPFHLVDAVAKLARHEQSLKIRLTWYGDNFIVDGKPGRFSKTFLDLQERVREAGLESRVVLKPKTKDILAVYQSADAVCLASFYEGFSNVLGEAVAMGKPILASRVCDNAVLVRDSVNGYLFDPHSVDDMADALKRMAALTPSDLERMSRASRKIAEEVLLPDRLANSYVELIERVTQK